MRLLHLIKSLGRGGAEMLLPETIKLHDHSRIEFHCIYFLPWKDQMVSAIENTGARVTCFEAHSNLGIIAQVFRLKKYVEHNKIDVVHCHLPWAGFVGRILGLLTKVKIVYTEHNKQERYHFATFLLNKLTFGWQNRVIAVSRDVQDSIRRKINPRVPVQVILNGVNTETFVRNPELSIQLRQKLGIPANAVVIGVVAVFRFQKRLPEWLQVFKKVAEDNPNVFGVIVGDGPLRNDVEAEIEKLKLRDRVKLPGLQTDMLPWYSMIDVFMMSSIFEGLPIALLEAMSAECAVVSTNAGGIGEVIEEGVSGFMVPVDQYETLVAPARQLVQDPELRSRVGREARQQVKRHFSMTSMVRQLEELYFSLGKRP